MPQDQILSFVISSRVPAAHTGLEDLCSFIGPDSGRWDGGGGRGAAAGENDQQAVAAGMGERWDEDRGKEGQRN